MANTIKMDVITGFLGAGKTTFIQYLLASGVFEGEKIVIIENEFGDISVDSGILSDPAYEIVDISGGCICCSVKHSMVDALKDIAQNIKPDRVIVEPSGVFVVEDIRGIIEAPQVRDDYQLSGIYTIVDSQFFLMDMMLRAPFFMSQLTYADHIIITKLQEDQDNLEGVLKTISQYNVTANVHVWRDEHFNTSTLSMMFSKSSCRLLEGELVADNRHQTLESHSFTGCRDFDSQSFEDLMSQVIAGDFGQVIRLKGYVSIDGLMNLVQLVHNQYTLRPADTPQSYLVLIGEQLQLDAFNVV